MASNTVFRVALQLILLPLSLFNAAIWQQAGTRNLMAGKESAQSHRQQSVPGHAGKPRKGATSQMAGTQSCVSKLKPLACAAVNSVTMVPYLQPPSSTRVHCRAAEREHNTHLQWTPVSCYPEINLLWNAIVKEGAWHQVKITGVDTAMYLCWAEISICLQKAWWQWSVGATLELGLDTARDEMW